jgi:cell division protein FtsW
MLNLMVDDLDGVLARAAEGRRRGAGAAGLRVRSFRMDHGPRRAQAGAVATAIVMARKSRLFRVGFAGKSALPTVAHSAPHFAYLRWHQGSFRVKLKHSTRDQPARVSRHTGNHKSENQEQGSNAARAGNMTEMAHGTIVVQSGEAVLPRWWRTVDRVTIGCVLALFAIGILLGFAASPPLAERNGHEPFHYVIRPFAFGGLALSGDGAGLDDVAHDGAAPGCAGLHRGDGALMLLPVFGTDFGQGAVRWFSLGFASVQPSEFLKPVFVIFTAWMIAASHEIGGPPGKIVSLVVTITIVAFLALQPDFGQAALIVFAWSVIYFVAGAPILILLGRDRRGGLGGLLRLPEFRAFRPPHRRVPVPEVDPNTQLGFATDAIREGGLFGAGLGEGSVKWTLPDAHTDFIIAVAAEEYGLILVLTIIALSARSWCAPSDAADARARSVHPAGRHRAVSLIALQAFINLGVAVRLLPAKGMTLPFVSYGGSSLIATGIAVGMLLCFTRTRPQGDIGDILFLNARPATVRASVPRHDRKTMMTRAHHISSSRPAAPAGTCSPRRRWPRRWCARLAGDAVDRCARRALYRRLPPYGRACGRWPRRPSRGAARWPRRWCRSASSPASLSATVAHAARPALGGRGLRRLSRDPGAGCGLAHATPPRMIHEQNGVLGRVNRSSRAASMRWPAALAHRAALGRDGRAYRQPGARRGAGAGRRALHAAGRLADEPSGLRRQPGRAHPVGRRARRHRASAQRRSARPSARGPAGPSRGRSA